ncbi:MAG: T9SS C-terminal target domain-containing protein [Cytophagales bacterium]|nr:MAG: T9SS C-terminal target domain-containing protein [Cytophagales bacterium]
MKHFLFLQSTVLLLFILCLDPAHAQPKREFRGAWVATVGNIDWPSSKTLTAAQQQAELVAILNSHQQAGMNAVVVQVRSVCDALYPSTLEPWAEVLTGKQGQSPGYDPLAFMIAECRKRGLEFHAWFNPYRAVTNITTANLDPTHVVRRKPEWLLAQANLRILNPGLPDVRQYVTSVIMDVVRRYDIDGVHFDDYFYPYPVTGQSFNDDSTFVRHNRGLTNRADWRRDNVNLLVKQVSDSIRAVKPWVKFGISPFGIWQNRTTAQPNGSATSGLQGYNEIFADSRTWIQAGWLDYIAPQLYWHIGNAAADYGVLVPWWNAVMQSANGRHLYIGQAAYRVGASGEPAGWQQPNQMPTQLRLNRQTPGIQGSIFYNTTSLNRNPLGLRDSLRTNFYARPALRPAMPWKAAPNPPQPTDLTATVTNNTVDLRWKVLTGSVAPNFPPPIWQFVVYRFEGNTAGDRNTAANIRAITPDATTQFVDNDLKPGVTYTYVVTTLDRLHNESNPSNTVQSQLVTAQEPVLATQFVNAPNPFSGETELRYTLTRPAEVSLRITDLNGREVTRLVNAGQLAGEHRSVWAARGAAPGVYFAELIVDGQKTVLRVVKQ